MNREPLLSIGVCAVLVAVGLVRALSYSQGALGDTVRHSILGILAYNPASHLNVQFFKILATPSVVAMFYLYFRWRNADVPFHFSGARSPHLHTIDFESPILRVALTSIITAHWLVLEWFKFNAAGFYPWSPLENRSLNVVVLILSQAVAFWGMKYLSFEPLAASVLPEDANNRSPVAEHPRSSSW